MDQQAYSNAVFFISGLDKRYKVNKRAGWVYMWDAARRLTLSLSRRVEASLPSLDLVKMWSLWG